MNHISRFLLALGILILISGKAHGVVWPNLRDGVIYLNVTKPVDIEISWENAWIAESQTDHVYLQKPDGALFKRYILDRKNTPGKEIAILTTPGIYRLEVAGANFREVTVAIPSGIQSMFEPVKVHKSVELPGKGRLYFRIPAQQPFSFAAKAYDDVSGFMLSPAGKNEEHFLRCQQHKLYAEFDSISVPARPDSVIWQLDWQGKGKTSFWLDQAANLFAQRPEDLFDLVFEAAVDEIEIHPEVVGTTPAIGAAFPFVPPPPDALPVIAGWHLSSANHYVFLDAFREQRKKGSDIKALYEKQFDLLQDNVIFGGSGRKMIFDSSGEASRDILEYLGYTPRQPGCITYYAISDEPNLNYHGFDQFAEQFGQIAAAIKNNPDPRIRDTLLAVPQSSRFLNGPTRPDAENRRGIDWAEKLIERYGNYIGAISWHEWLVRDLIDTGRYREAVECASALVEKHHDKFAGQPALVIGQTNISSGPTLSPYENDTFFAALWWASVVIESSLPGKLQQLNWFKAADDNLYKKGLVAIRDGKIIEKPVAKAMAFVNRNLGRWVLRAESPHPDVDVLASLASSRKQVFILGVNKSPRRHRIDFSLPGVCQNGVVNVLSASGPQEEIKAERDTRIRISLAKEEIFSLRCEMEKPIP